MFFPADQKSSVASVQNMQLSFPLRFLGSRSSVFPKLDGPIRSSKYSFFLGVQIRARGKEEYYGLLEIYYLILTMDKVSHLARTCFSTREYFSPGLKTSWNSHYNVQQILI
jgi:hypothetical protein